MRQTNEKFQENETERIDVDTVHGIDSFHTYISVGTVGLWLILSTEREKERVFDICRDQNTRTHSKRHRDQERIY